MTPPRASRPSPRFRRGAAPPRRARILRRRRFRRRRREKRGDAAHRRSGAVDARVHRSRHCGGRDAACCHGRALRRGSSTRASPRKPCTSSTSPRAHLCRIAARATGFFVGAVSVAVRIVCFESGERPTSLFLNAGFAVSRAASRVARRLARPRYSRPLGETRQANAVYRLCFVFLPIWLLNR